MKESEKLRGERTEELKAARAIVAAAEAEERDLTDEETEQVEAHTAKAQELADQAAAAEEKEQKRLQLLATLADEEARDSAVQPPLVQVDPTSRQRQARLSQPNIVGGEGASQFSHFGEFLFAVRRADHSNAESIQLQQKLEACIPLEYRQMASISGAGTTVDAELGALVPPEYSSRILQIMHDRGKIISLPFMSMPLGGNHLTIPAVNETSRADGSRAGGVRGYWVGEGEAPTVSGPTVRTIDLHLHKAGCLGHITEELRQDATGAGAFMELVFAKELVFQVEDAIIRGSGSKKPMGLKNALCKIEISKETNQTADTIWGPNILKMFARRNPGGADNNVWLCNQDCEPSLLTVTAEGRYGSAATSAEGVYLYDPPSTRNGGMASLMGRPVIPCEFCDTVGDAGDLILFDPTQYVFATKRGADAKLRIESSIHVRFKEDEQTFRAFYRCDGQPWWSAALTPYKGTNTQSPIITLAARA